MTAIENRRVDAAAVRGGPARPRAVIAHCWTGTPASGWYPDLARQLERLGMDVAVPALPDSDDPDPRAWYEALQADIGAGVGPVLLIGHSLGALAVLRWLLVASAPAPKWASASAAMPWSAPDSASRPVRVSGAVLVAPPIGPSGLAVVRRFAVGEDELPSALAAVPRTLVVVSDADPYLLPTPAAVAVAFEAAGAASLTVPGKGHFSPASGLLRLPEVLPFLRDMAQAGRQVAAQAVPD